MNSGISNPSLYTYAHKVAPRRSRSHRAKSARIVLYEACKEIVISDRSSRVGFRASTRRQIRPSASALPKKDLTLIQATWVRPFLSSRTTESKRLFILLRGSLSLSLARNFRRIYNILISCIEDNLIKIISPAEVSHLL